MVPLPCLDVFGRFLAPVGRYFIFDHNALTKRTQARALDSGDMHEHILAAALRLNETVSLGRVEPFHSTSSQRGALMSFLAAGRTNEREFPMPPFRRRNLD